MVWLYCSQQKEEFCMRWVLLILGLATTQTYAAQVLGVQVTHDGARFLIGMHIAIDAAPPDVFRALRDYAAMPRYNPDLVAVRIEPTSEPNRVRLFTTVHLCVLFFCRTMHQEQLMTATANATGGILQAELIPQDGAFKGLGHWAVNPCRDDRPQSCVDAQIELVPVFWVPPVIGPWLIRKKMYEEAERSSAGLEQVALAPVPK
jgi:hypothetical protein